ncbi:DNA topoisomerase 3 [Escherichia coli]|nr:MULTISPECIES: type IA DNA topoisomerase [Enterobacteriaceae]EAM9826617.1 type IA DNA topoisomerase [Salmonella enterica]EBZ0864370.1 type IA DNA topoisomerase [Salmonella enterica subsp. enterica serovar Ajiobo]ECB7872096.1 type IA DNA topoisomerase [Salmonella enterica subsp. enterica serovar Agona]ECG1227868.1 type IA DNA topoisomerase [Salmonella enterica subsp. enterica serovar Paratyphi B]ECQ9037731.1 DNA topoisomerase III [Salmonella enterica subsp. enterica]EDN3718886.1 type IA DNA 
MRLFIAEKPAVANDIVKALGGNFTRHDGWFESDNAIVTNCFGHIIESQPPENYNPEYKAWKVETLPLRLYPVKYQPVESAEKQVKTIIELIRRADVTEIIHAGDPDDEGQLLVDEVLEYAGNTKPVKRVLINDNTLPAVKKALANPKNNRDFRGLYLKALARSVADAIYGLSMTRAYTIPAKTKGYKGVLSVGRVQTPVLGLIVNRTRANKNHKSSFYYTMTGHFQRGADVIRANWKPGEFAPLTDRKLLDKTWANGTATSLAGKPATVEAAATDDKKTAAPLPFNLVRLQQYMNKKFKMTAQKTLDITQQLREKYKAITYNRSDCSYLSDEQFSEAPQIIDALKSVFDQPMDIDTTRKSKAFNSAKVTAHTAIIPTVSVPDVNALSTDERNVYLAIAQHYLVQFMPEKAYQEVSVAIQCGDESFYARARKTTDSGFEAFLGVENAEDDEAEVENDDSSFDLLCKIRTGETVTTKEVVVNEKKTTPPPLFTEATLLAALVRVADFVTDPVIKKLLKDKDRDKKDEHGGIGTPATRASILETLKKRNYITLEKGKLIPTDTGYALIDALPDIAVNPDMTALWAEKQTLIENGEMTVEQFVDELYNDLIPMISNANSAEIKVSPSAPSGQSQRLSSPCPSCGKQIVIRPKSYSCTGCEFKIWNEFSGKKITQAQAEKLIKSGKTDLIKGFKKKSGGTYDAVLVLEDKKTGKLGFPARAKK